MLVIASSLWTPTVSLRIDILCRSSMIQSWNKLMWKSSTDLNILDACRQALADDKQHC